MSDSGGGDKSKTGLAGNWKVLSVICPALVVAVLMLWFFDPEGPYLPVYETDKTKAADYQTDATNCSPKVLSAIRSVRERTVRGNECADKAEEHRIKTNDLIQQTRAADAAKAQAIFAFYQSRLALWATVGGFLTLIAAGLAAAYARDAARQGKRSADAALDAVAETYNANEIARESMERQLRAYLRICGKTLPTPTYMTINYFGAILSLDNLGVTPAQKVEIFTQVFFAPFPLPDNHIIPKNWKPCGSNIVIHKSVKPHDMPAHNPKISAGKMARISGVRPKVVMYVAAKASYTDSFNNNHIEEACFACKFLSDGTARFEAANRHNSST